MKPSLVAFVLVVVTAACGSDPAPTTTCPQTIDAYCANASPKCARKIDPNDVVKSFCDGTSAGVSFGYYPCGSGRVLVSSDPLVYDYSASTHELTVIVDKNGKCIAGPPSFTTPTEKCTGFTVGYQCGGPNDGGADAKAD